MRTVLCLLSLCWSVTTIGYADPPTASIQERLARGTIVSIDAKGMPLSDILNKLETATKMKFRVIGRFGRDDKQALATKITVKIQKQPFWKAIEAIEKAAGVQFTELEDGVLILSKRGPQFPDLKPVGNSIVQGAFHITPKISKTFKDLRVVIRPEPWVCLPQVKEYRATIVIDDNKKTEYQSEREDLWFNIQDLFTKELTPRIHFRRLPKGVNKAKSLNFEIKLDIPTEWKQIQLPPIAQIVPKTANIEKGKVTVEQAEMIEQGPKKQQILLIRLRCHDVKLDRKKINLVDSKKKSITTNLINEYQSRGAQVIELRFRPDQLPKNWQELKLSAAAAGGDVKEFGTLKQLSTKPVEAGRAQVKIVGTEIIERKNTPKLFAVKLIIHNYQVPHKLFQLVDDKGNIIKPEGWSESGGIRKQITFEYHLKEIEGKLKQLRYTIDAPVKTTEYTLKLELKDVPLKQ